MNAKTITLAQQKGGAGKTTISIHLAVALGQMGKKVILLDADPQGTTSHWYNLRKSIMGDDFTTIDFKAISGWNTSNECLRLRNEYDYIIVDTPPHLQTDAKSAIDSANLTIIPVQPSPADLWATKETVNIAQNAKCDFCLILNRTSHNSKLAQEIVDLLNTTPMATITNRVSMASALMKGKTVTETQPRSPAALEIQQLAKKVTKILNPSKMKAA